MKRYIYTLFAVLMFTAVDAQTTADDNYVVRDLKMSHNNEFMIINMTLDLSSLNIKSDEALILTPNIVGDGGRTDLQSVGVYGKRRHLVYMRNDSNPLSGDKDVSYKESERPNEIYYQAVVPYEEWMNGSKLYINEHLYGCSDKLIDSERNKIGGYNKFVYTPKFAYVSPQAEEVKSRSLQGSAFIDFPVSQTIIRPEYRNNQYELSKIYATIDSVRRDSDISITALSIKGFASPESPYDNNTRLAKGRTEALREHVSRLYEFPDSFIKTSYEPENWEGLRKFVESSSLHHKTEILALIDSDYEPDYKESRIKSIYPDEYRFLLDVCYPALRRSDYKIEYVIRAFSDIDEIKRLVKTHPQKLSLQEFYLASKSLEPGSDEFNDVFETAVRMYPEDTIANLNAANIAMGKGDMRKAERYLVKAGDSDEANYARGIYHALKGDYDKAESIFNTLKDKLPQAADAIEQINKVKNN